MKKKTKSEGQREGEYMSFLTNDQVTKYEAGVLKKHERSRISMIKVQSIAFQILRKRREKGEL